MKLQRTIPPEIKPVAFKSIPETELFILENGIHVYLIDAGTEELMRVDFIFKAGQVEEDFPLVASTTNTMLLEGSVNYNANEINRIFDFYGAFINPFNQKDSAGVSAFFLNKHIEKIVSLCYEILFRPVFPEDELNNLQKKRLQSYLLNRERVQNIASDRFYESVFGSCHPYGRQVLPADFENVTRTMLDNFHREFYNNGNLNIIISGKIHPRTKIILNSVFGKGESRQPRAGTKNHLIEGNKIKKDFLEKKDAVQSAIRIGSATINKKHCDYNGLLVLDTILGGYFGSRLMNNIREDKGYTYGINSSLISLKQSGYKIISTEVGKNYTSQTLDEIYKEIRLLQTKPVETRELDVVRSFMAGEMVRMFDGPFALSESFRSAWEYGFDSSYYYKLAEKIKRIEPDEIMNLANTYYKTDDLYEIIAGSK